MEIKAAAKKFREYWNSRSGYEKGEDQQFWNSLLRDVLGAEDIESSIKYQVPVKLKNTTKFLDAWIPETRVLIEHKSRGVNLDAPQAGHNGLTPYEQAKEYDDARGFDEKARWIVLCNFDEFLVYDCAKPLDEPERITLADLPKEIHRLSFLVDKKVSKVDSKELEISVQAGRIVAKLYDALLKQFGSNTPETLAALNRLCVRLVFCLYAEDADIFPKNALRNLVKLTPVEFLRRQLLRLFQTLDTPIEKRDRYLEAELAVFPYTNGGLFAGASESEIPPLTEEIALLLDGSSNFDWSGISPTIFGALFESTLNPDTRRAGGMVYTSVENIHKVIDPLFMDGLTERVDELLGVGESKSRVEVEERIVKNSAVGLGLQTSTKKKLLALQDEMASLTFLDPACGSGNFLTETYLSLRRLENRIIAALQGGQGELDLGEGIGAKVSIHQFKGIEINDFAVSVAKTAMWIAEAQMHAETCDILHSEPDFLPLKEYDGIVQGNALRTNWGRLESNYDYIMGNPPFVGYSLQSKEQKADILELYRDEKGKPYKTAGKVDYVAGWYWKAAELALAASTAAKAPADKKNTKVAFVSTNSICQGEQVAAVWKPLVERFGLEIDFAYRTFRWDSEAHEKAHVHCVIVGFSFNNASNNSLCVKKIFDGDKVIEAEHINGYLMDGADVWVESRTKPICEVPVMIAGGKPAEGGNLILTKEEKDALLKKEPQASVLIRPFMMGADFIQRSPRYCLWMKNAAPQVIRSCPSVMERVAKVREFRLSSKKPATRLKAETPTLFDEIREPSSDYVALPKVSSENRKYIPIDYLKQEVIPGDKLFVLSDVTPYHFGVLTSSVHMAWMRTVCGRLKSDYSYSNTIVYNNFPWPSFAKATAGKPDLRDSATPREKISQTAQAILDARALYPDSSLADLYDPLTMPPELRKAHAANDRAVLAAYGLAPDTAESEIVAHLMKLYQNAQ
jgi:hypothetical protein